MTSQDARIDAARRWLVRQVRGKRWWLRAPLLPVLGWILAGHVRDPDRTSLLHGITLGFHELGHLVLGVVGLDLLTAAGGTLFQLGVPLAAAGYLLLRQRDPFGATFGTFWLGSSLVEAGRYAADARARALPLVSPFGPVDAGSHDWAFMLGHLGLLEHDTLIGAILRDAGIATMALSLIAGAWVLRVMATARAAGPGAGTGKRRRDRPHPAGSEEERFRAFLDRKGGGPG